MKSTDIMHTYLWYRYGLLSVDRSYQRKLVWTLEEKQALIDTILRVYPLPMFMMITDYPDDDTAPRNIMDGLQRLEAIFSFIENKYPIQYEGEERYFNLDCLAGYTAGADYYKGVEPGGPALDATLCSKFLTYELPMSNIRADSSEIEEIFKRINSTGRKLSLQCLRQAGVTSRFSSIVQEIASKVRGDYTEDLVVPFSKMQSLSLSSKGLDYGLCIENIFWIEQDIINSDALRRSKDEEIIANIINCLINGGQTGMSKKALDSAYNSMSNIFISNEQYLAESSNRDFVTELMLDIFADLQKIFCARNTTFTNLLCRKPDTSNKDLMFIVLFLAIAGLRRANYRFEDYKKAADRLKNLAQTDLFELTDSHYHWNIENRNHLVERVTQQLKKCMTLQAPVPKWDEEVRDILKAAKVETQFYDFKIGARDLRNGEDNLEKVVAKCIETLVAMANTKPGSTGFVIIGVADSESDAEDFRKFYGVDPLKCGSYYITGIDAEVGRFHQNNDDFITKVKANIAKESTLEKEVISSILTDMHSLQYDNRTLLVLSLKTDKPLVLRGSAFVRYMNSNHEIPMSNTKEFMTFMDKFYSSSAAKPTQLF